MFCVNTQCTAVMSYACVKVTKSHAIVCFFRTYTAYIAAVIQRSGKMCVNYKFNVRSYLSCTRDLLVFRLPFLSKWYIIIIVRCILSERHRGAMVNDIYMPTRDEQ